MSKLPSCEIAAKQITYNVITLIRKNVQPDNQAHCGRYRDLFNYVSPGHTNISTLKALTEINLASGHKKEDKNKEKLIILTKKTYVEAFILTIA